MQNHRTEAGAQRPEGPSGGRRLPGAHRPGGRGEWPGTSPILTLLVFGFLFVQTTAGLRVGD